MEKLTVTEYQEWAMTTCTPKSANVPYMAFNLSSEVDEVFEKLRTRDWATTEAYRQHIRKHSEGETAKAIRKGEILAPIVPKYTPEELEGITLEIGDCAWQLAGLCHVLGISFEDALQKNLNKLKDRATRGTIVGDGDNR